MTSTICNCAQSDFDKYRDRYSVNSVLKISLEVNTTKFDIAKNGFAEISKNLTRYRSENKFNKLK